MYVNPKSREITIQHTDESMCYKLLKKGGGGCLSHIEMAYLAVTELTSLSGEIRFSKACLQENTVHVDIQTDFNDFDLLKIWKVICL